MKRILFLVFLGGFAFAFRLLMGFSKFYRPDALQVYLIGLKSFVQDTFPFFGPDVVYTQTQIPGALQGLLISIPLSIWPIPESPYILLNLLSFISLLFFGWYLTSRFPAIPKWFTYGWLMTCPWTLHYSVHIENPSYVIIGAILFFVAVIELSRFYDDTLINKNLLFSFLGFALFWIMQFHLSWVMLLPFLGWVAWKNKDNVPMLLRGTGYFALGSIVSVSTLIPTLILFNSGGVESNIVFNPKNLLSIPTTILRFLSFASYEMGRFLGSSTEVRLQFVYDRWWIAPVLLFLLITGFLQVGYFILCFFRKKERQEWKYVKWFIASALLILSISFLFSVIDPRAHMFYFLFPLAMWYSFYCYESVFKFRHAEKFALAVIVSGIMFQVSLFFYRFEKQSLFSHREKVMEAIANNDYTLLALRRESKMMKSHKKVVWWNEMKNDGSFYACTEFEPTNSYFVPQNLIRHQKVETGYQCKIDSMQPYSISLSDSLSKLNYPKHVKASFWLRSDAPKDFSMVCEIKSDSDNLWMTHDIDAEPTNGSNWKEHSLEFELPEPRSNEASIRFYFWQKEKMASRMYLDNLCFELK